MVFGQKHRVRSLSDRYYIKSTRSERIRVFFPSLYLSANLELLFISIVFGYMYPAYQTFKALDSKDKEARLQLLRYWAVFAAFASAEFYTDLFISWLPFYYELKMLILLWLSVPFTKGSSTIYEMHMKPWLRAHQEEIDIAIAQLHAHILSCILHYKDRAASWANATIQNFLQQRLPAALPLFHLMVALSKELFNTLLAAASSKSAAKQQQPEGATAVEKASITPRSEETSANKLSSDHLTQQPPAQSAPAVAAPPMSQLGQVAFSKTSANITTAKPHSTASAHAREVSAPVGIETRAAKRNALHKGTAMPRPTSTSIASKPVPPPKKEKVVPKSEGFADSIIAAGSPSKRSNPQLVPGSPQRRSAC